MRIFCRTHRTSRNFCWAVFSITKLYLKSFQNPFFADGREGMVAVRLARTPEGRGQLTVEDNGLGFDPQTPTKGIGRRLISALTQQLGGESRFETAIDGGSLFTLTFPLASPETRPSATPLP